MRRALLIVIGGALAAAPRAGASGVGMTSSVSSHVLRDGGAPVRATLTLKTAGAGKTVAVGLDPSQWQDRLMVGSPIRTFDRTITGAGRITGFYASGGTGYVAGSSRCVRGGAGQTGGGVDVFLPARSTTRLSWKVMLAAPPWVPEATYLGWYVAVPGISNDPDRINHYEIGPQQFEIAGPTGVDVRLSAGTGSRHPTKGSLLPYRVVRAGHRVTITGVTRPHVAHTRIDIGYAATTGNRHGRIGSATTDGQGRLSITWRPRTPGIYTITSALPHPPKGFLPDHNCDLALTVS